MPLMNPPRGTFEGQNFMTPTWLGYYRVTVEGREAWAELSTGTGITGRTIYGVTVAPSGNFAGRLAPPFKELSEVFSSKQDALDYIEALAKGA